MNDLNLFRADGSVYLREVSSKEDVFKDLECDGFLVRSNEKSCRAIVASLKDKAKVGSGKNEVRSKFLIAFVGGDDVLNRRAVETLDIDYLVSPERDTLRDTLKQRDSGLNHVVAKKAKERGIGIVVDMGEIGRMEGKEKAVRIGKVAQNVRVCRKSGCRILIASLGGSKKEVFSEKVRKAFGIGLGMSSEQIKDCVRF